MRGYYSTYTLPQYVREWFGVKRMSEIRMTKVRPGRWCFDANGKSVPVYARTAPQARRALCDHISEVAPRWDLRRNVRRVP